MRDEGGVQQSASAIARGTVLQEMNVGEWHTYSWWQHAPDVLLEAGFSRSMIERAICELRRTFDSDWAHDIKSKPDHWFLHAVVLPLKQSIVELVELGLGVAAAQDISPESATRIRRQLRDEQTLGSSFEVFTIGILATAGYRPDFHPKGRGKKVLDTRIAAQPPLDIEVKGILEDRRDALARRVLVALGDAIGDGLGGACQTSRYVRIDISEHTMSLLIGPSEHSRLTVSSLTEHAKGLASRLLEALARHDPAGYGRDTVAGVLCESWPREEEGIQTTLLGPVIESRSVAERIYRNALLDAAEKFSDTANGVTFVYLTGGEVDLSYFVGMWNGATQTNVLRNIAALVVMWRPTIAMHGATRWEAVILANPQHARATQVVELLTEILSTAENAISLRPCPKPGPSSQRRMMSINPWIVIPPLSSKHVVLRPDAEPPNELVERFLRTAR